MTKSPRKDPNLPPLDDYKRRVEYRLLRKLERDENGCLVWVGPVGLHRPVISLRLKGKHKIHYIHRVAAWLWLGFDLDSPLKVLHTCDNPLCCNPGCLYIGTQADNVRDAVKRGRWTQGSTAASRAAAVKGENHHRSKLTKDQIVAIRKAVREGESRRAVAKRHHVTIGTVGSIVRNQSWKHIK